MMTRRLSLPQLGLIAGTRAMAGAGLGLLLADRLSNEQRRAVGWTLLAVGALTTVPLIAQVLTTDQDEPRYAGRAQFAQEEA